MSEKIFDRVFQTRGLTSIFYVLAWMAALFIHPVMFIVCMAAALFICFREFERMVLVTKTLADKIFIGSTFALAAILLYDYALAPDKTSLVAAIMLLYLVLGIVFLTFSRKSFLAGSLRSYRSIYPMAGILACVLIYFPKGMQEYAPLHLLSLLVLIWANDSYAYIAGRTWGRNSLWASISPKKTWEGTIGGAAGTFFTGILWAQIVPGSGMAEMMTAAAVVSVFGPLGDLFESSIKRAAGVKDSGNWLPGHGGLLDRLDSLLWAAPAYWLAITLFSF